MASSVFISYAGPSPVVVSGSAVTWPVSLTLTSVLTGDGSASAVGHGFSAAPTTGWFRTAQGLEAAVNAASVFRLLDIGFLSLSGSTSGIGFGATHATADALLFRTAVGVLSLQNGAAPQALEAGPSGNTLGLSGQAAGSASYLYGTEGTAPTAPAPGGFRLFAQDNGGGKTQLMVIFGSGAAQQLAIEP